MKKIISLIGCTVLLLALVSCGKEEHVHKYNRNEWVSDASNHWYAAECDCEDAGIVSKAAHVDESMKDGFCDICGALVCANTEYDAKYYNNEYSHWQYSTCGHNGSTSHLAPKQEPHNFVEADGKAICEDCKYECQGLYKKNYTSDENGHYYALSCGHTNSHAEMIEFAEHDFDQSAKCTVCGYVCPGIYKWAFDEEGNHWQELSCGHEAHTERYKNEGTHADADNDGKCDKCEFVIPTTAPDTEE